MAMTKSQRLARKRRFAALAGLRDDNRQVAVARRIKREEDPRRVVMEARTRMMAHLAKGDLMLPMYEHPCGRAIAAKARDAEEAVALWAVFDPLDKADAAYCRHVLGVSRFAKTAKIELLPEVFEVRPDQKPDLRTDEERCRDASAVQDRWRGYMRGLTRGERDVIHRMLRGLSEPLRDGKITTDGHRFVRAMRSLRNHVSSAT